MSSAVRTGPAPLADLLEEARVNLVTLTPRIRYFAALDPFTEEDLRDYLEDPVTALPPAIAALLPEVAVLLVPYLEPLNGREKHAPEKHTGGGKTASRRGQAARPAAEAPPIEPTPEAVVLFARPANDPRLWRGVHWQNAASSVVIALAVGDQEVADYHYQLYRHLATLAVTYSPAESLAGYLGLIREELNSRMNGEVDERSWQLKQSFLRHRSQVRRDSKEFRDYARQSFIDTLTLYLHGICCDIDVDTGPRQLPSRHLRRRLRHLRELYPPPQGYAVFPEELDRMQPSE